jgi:murein L,D-transpeptidase YcbB/YkuD
VSVLGLGVSAGGDDAPAADAALRETLRRRIELAAAAGELGIGDQRTHAVVTLARFYEARAFVPVWVDPGGPIGEAYRLSAALADAVAEGLRPDDYHHGEIERRLAAAGPWSVGGDCDGGSRLVELELLLTDAFVLYGSHLLSGRLNPQTIDPEWLATPRSGDMARVLESAVESGDVARALSELRPPQPGYGVLRDALARLRSVAAAGGWSTEIQDVTLRVGDLQPAVSDLRRRLRAGGDLVGSDAGDPDLFDEQVETAVRRFQDRHGLESDGVVGPVTRSELAVAVEDRIDQLIVNLERWRWLPQDLGRRHLRVNIAGFDLEARDGDVVELGMRVVVGQPYRRTPVFSDSMTYLVLNPSWTIPPRLAVEDKLPLIRKDPSYLQRQRISVFSGWGADATVVDPATVDWAALGAKGFPYRLRQEPGPLNALGRIKFMFPNQFDVYLHDTPQRELFGKAARDFSSGCIRLQRPLELAEWVLRPDASWTRARLESSLASNQEQTVRLPKPVPVHMLYWTAWADPDGLVNFRRDVYARDRRVLEALTLRPPAP